MHVGDITNWMNQTSGEFNYTGLVANMEMKAGSFYGMISSSGAFVRSENGD